MNYSSANIQGWQPFSFTWATLLNCHEGFIFISSRILSSGHVQLKKNAEEIKINDTLKIYSNVTFNYIYRKYTTFLSSYSSFA